MVLVDEKAHPKASWEFDADIAILTHSTTIQPRYQAVIHCEIIRQAARVVAMVGGRKEGRRDKRKLPHPRTEAFSHDDDPCRTARGFALATAPVSASGCCRPGLEKPARLEWR